MRCNEQGLWCKTREENRVQSSNKFVIAAEYKVATSEIELFQDLYFVQGKRYRCYDITKLHESRFSAEGILPNVYAGCDDRSVDSQKGLGYSKAKSKTSSLVPDAYPGMLKKQKFLRQPKVPFDVNNLECNLPESFRNEVSLVLLSDCLKRSTRTSVLLRCLHYGEVHHFLCVKGGHDVLVAFAHERSAQECSIEESNAKLVTIIE